MRIRRRIVAAIVAVCVAVPVLQGMQGGPTAISPVAGVDAAPIEEMSGIVKSARYRDVYWVHNDSGDRARFFAIAANGKAIVPTGTRPEAYQGIAVANAKNVDWEDIARDRDTLYLSDMGNNGNARRDLGVYAVKEPDPRRTTEVRGTFLPIAYPDQKEFPPSGLRAFDCEAVFALRGKLYFVTKHRLNALIPGSSTGLYRLDTRHTDRVNVLTKLDTHANLGGWVTAADVSPDGKTVAVLTQAPEQSIWLFDARAKGDRFLSQGKPRRIVFSGAKQCEAVAFADNGTLLVGNEQRDLYKLRVADAKPVRTPVSIRAAKRVAKVAREDVVRPLRKSLREAF
ncbi:MAG: hypothetical protein ACO1SV_09190 [Fimbriimonas sp.]